GLRRPWRYSSPSGSNNATRGKGAAEMLCLSRGALLKGSKVVVMRISTLLSPSCSQGIERASRLRSIGLLIVLGSLWPAHGQVDALPFPESAPLAPGATAWEVAKGEPADWKILSDRLECKISEPSAHWVIS